MLLLTCSPSACSALTRSGCSPRLRRAVTPWWSRGDTLSRIAERRDVSEALLLRDNPGLSGLDDLWPGQELRLRRDAPDPGTRFDRAVGSVNTLASRAGDVLNGLAGEVGASVDDLLTKNPDLHSRLRQLGGSLGISGADASAAIASISPAGGTPGTLVTVSALGLPANTLVDIGTGARRSANEVLDRARTSGDPVQCRMRPGPAPA